METTEISQFDAAMALDYKAQIRQHYKLLLRAVDVSEELLNSLSLIDALEAEMSSVKSQPTSKAKCGRLLEILRNVAEEHQEAVMAEFLSALRDNDQEHVANLFVKTSEKVPMSWEHYELLQRNTDKLCRFIDPKGGLTESLLSIGVFNESDVERVGSKSTFEDMAQELIRILLRKSDCCFEKFLRALTDTAQPHVAYILTGQGSPPMTGECVQRLNEERLKLVENIEPVNSNLLSALISCGAFTHRDRQRVEARQTTDRKTEELLDLLMRKPQSAFDGFLTALNQTGQDHVVRILAATMQEVSGTVEAVFAEVVTESEKKSCETELKQHIENSTNYDINQNNIVTTALSANGVSVLDVKDGSIIINFGCYTGDSLGKLRELYSSGTLDRLFSEVYCPPLADKGLLELKLSISLEEFDRCADLFDQLKLMTSYHRQALDDVVESHLDKFSVTGDLLNKLPLCRRRKQAILAATTNREQVRTLLAIVSRQPDCVFSKLVSAFRETGQHEAAACLEAGSKQSEEESQAESEGMKENRQPVRSNWESLYGEQQLVIDSLTAEVERLQAAVSEARRCQRSTSETGRNSAPVLRRSHQTEGGVMGVTQLDEEVYVVCFTSDRIQVFSSCFERLRDIHVKGLEPRDIVACRESRTVYVADYDNYCV